MRNVKHILNKILPIALFVFIEVIAIHFYSQKSLYFGTKLSHFFLERVGGFNEKVDGIFSYFDLKKVNIELAKQNSVLSERIIALEATLNNIEEYKAIDNSADSCAIVSLFSKSDEYFATSATVVKNSTNNSNNFITLNKGRNDGVEKKMAVVSGSSIVGNIVAVSDNYSIVATALGKDMKISGMLKNNEALCLVYWDAVDAKTLCFTEMSKYNEVNVGDTIITTGFSTIYPPNFNIGVIKSIEKSDRVYLKGKIVPSQDFEKIKFVTILDNKFFKERREIESKVNNN